MDTVLIQEIKECGAEHPARILDFDVLLSGLLEEEKKGNVNIKYHPDYPQLALFKYTQDCVTERNWNKFTLMSRGLILDIEDKKVVATSFTKFFNYSEMEDGECSFLEPDFTTSLKYDGSLIITFSFKDKWMTATCGSFISDQAIWAREWLYNNVNIEYLDITNTYNFEAIYPENKIVVSYDFSGLVLLSIFDKYGLEYTSSMLEYEANHIGTKLRKEYKFNNVSKILKIAKKLDHNQEGFVIRFKSGVRLKIKGDEYVRIHRLISRVTPISIWELLLNKDDLVSIRKDLPEELEKDFNTMVSILQENLETFIEEVETIYENTKDMSDKEFGIYLYQHPEAFEGGRYTDAKRFIFMRRNNKFYEGLSDVNSKMRRKIFNVFRPTGNNLVGYQPSNVINRFSEETDC